MGRNFRKVIEMQTGGWRQDRATGAWHQDVEAYYVPISCNHCGLVVIDTKKCVGCGLCAKACLYGVPVLNPATRKMSKCDACADRLDHGLQPICVESCPQRAIEFGPIDELRKKYGDRATIAPLPDADLTKPSLVIRPPKGLEA